MRVQWTMSQLTQMKTKPLIKAGKRMRWCGFDTVLKSVNFNTMAIMATNTCECCDFDAELQHLPPARRVA
jgi:hypothetical protein